MLSSFLFSPIQTFHLFHKRAISIETIDGIGVDETDYDEIFEIYNNWVFGNVNSEIKTFALSLKTWSNIYMDPQ